MTTSESFDKMRSLVNDILPKAKVCLFGSRASFKAHEESDWDLLIIDVNPVDRKIKARILKALFPLSLEIGAFIQIVLVSDNDWKKNPAYYSLRLSVNRNPTLV